MSVTLVMTVVGAAGVAFYLRFLLALWREPRPEVGGYWVRLRLESDEDPTFERNERETTASRAA